MPDIDSTVAKTPERSWISLLWFVALCLGVEFAGGLLTSVSVRGWYLSIAKPSWTPPGWVFGPVWTVLYLTMAVSAWLVWRERKKARLRTPMMLFVAQLVLNLAWSAAFFTMQNPRLGCLVIVILWVLILGMIVEFREVRPLAGRLLLPYLGWVTFAAFLNFTIWRLNS